MTYDIENGKRLAEAARKAMARTTEGPWVNNDQHSGLGWRVETDADGYPNDGWVVASELLGPDAEANARFIAYARSGVPALAADLLAAHAEIERLREALGDAREDLMWSAYAMGAEKDGRWSHLHMSDGEWLARELGLDCKLYDYDADAIKEAIPVKARALLETSNE